MALNPAPEYGRLGSRWEYNYGYLVYAPELTLWPRSNKAGSRLRTL